jgi:hypothetical protein
MWRLWLIIPVTGFVHAALLCCVADAHGQTPGCVSGENLFPSAASTTTAEDELAHHRSIPVLSSTSCRLDVAHEKQERRRTSSQRAADSGSLPGCSADYSQLWHSRFAAPLDGVPAINSHVVLRI